MSAPEFIQTERLILRQPVASDASAIFQRYANDPIVTRYLAWPRHATIEDSMRFLEFSDNAWSTSVGGPYLIVSRATGVVLGSAGFAFEEPGCASVGYVLAEDAWGQGYATEALGALITAAKEMGVARLDAHCHPDHAVSTRVLEKCGFSLRGRWERNTVFPNLGTGELQDVLCYSVAFGSNELLDSRAGYTTPRLSETVRIEYLADYPQHVATLAAWFYEQWRWFLPPESSPEAIGAKFLTHLNREVPPIAFVALDGDELLGTASLRVNDMDILTDLSPWLGGVYVAPQHRQKGVGRLLVSAVEQKALDLGCRLIYLFTFDQEPFYSRLEWRLLKHLEYHGYPVMVMHKALADGGHLRPHSHY